MTVTGLELADPDMLYAGVVPFLAGVYQINIRLPAETPDGDLPVTARRKCVNAGRRVPDCEEMSRLRRGCGATVRIHRIHRLAIQEGACIFH